MQTCFNYSLSIQIGLAVSGTILSLAGSLIIAFAQVLESTESILERSITYWGYNTRELDAIIDQKIKSGYGITLIFAGSVIQIFSATYPLPDINSGK